MCSARPPLLRAGRPCLSRLALSVLHGAILLLIATPGLSSRPVAEDLPTMVITDALGREVVMPRPAERIAMGGRAVLMLADALYLFPGASERLVGVGQITQGKGNFLEAIDPHYHDGRTIFASAVGPEQIVATRPDVVILKSIMRNELGHAISQLGIPVVYVDLETPEQYERDLRIFGHILEQEARAEELVAYFREIRRAVQQRTASLPAERKPRVLLLYYSESAGEPVFSIPPSRWIQSDLVRTAGGAPVWVDEHPGGGWAPVGFEQIAAWDPDKIVLVAYRHGIDQVTDSVRRRPQWRELRAVRDGHLYGFASDFYSWDQPDVRWLLGLQWLATRIQPEIFSDLDIDAAMRDFFSTLYAMTDAEIDTVIVPRLEGDLH